MTLVRASKPGQRVATTAALAAAAVASALIAACQTLPQIPAALTAAEFFQRAQDASSSQSYRAALSYYEEFRIRFSDDRAEVPRLVWADYEVAFLHHKLGNDALAIEQLEALLTRYGNAEAGDWQRGPETLARRVLVELRQPSAATDAAGST